MHYCQECDVPQLMKPDGTGAAGCPRCGYRDLSAACLPLFVVIGASGAGKTTILGPLLGELAGTAAVFDVDWLIDPFGRQPGVDALDWPSLRDAWLHVAHGVAQNGLPTVLLAPFIPDQLEALPGRQWVERIHYLLLDAPDVELRRRLKSRPPWRQRDADAQIAFARWLRANVSPAVDTSVGPPAGTAQAVAAWVRGILGVAVPARPRRFRNRPPP